MNALQRNQQRLLLAELEGVPEEYFPFLLQMIRNYRKSVLLQPVVESFRSGWTEAKKGQ
jgi:hypothetical protein